MTTITDYFFDRRAAEFAFHGLSVVPLIRRGKPGLNIVSRTVTLEELTDDGECTIQTSQVGATHLSDTDAMEVLGELLGVAQQLRSSINGQSQDVRYRVTVTVVHEKAEA